MNIIIIHIISILAAVGLMVFSVIAIRRNIRTEKYITPPALVLLLMLLTAIMLIRNVLIMIQ